MEQQNHTQLRVSLAVLENQLQSLTQTIEKMEREKTEQKSERISREEFDRIRKIVDGIVTIIVSSVVLALLALILKGSTS